MSWVNFIVEGAGAYIDAQNARDKAKLQERSAASQKIANEAQAQLADNNAQLANWQAADALYRAGMSVRNSRTNTRLLKGAQRTAFAKSGVALDSGSVANILTDTDVLGEEDAQTKAFNGEREAWALRMQALDSRNRAAILRASDVPVASDPDRAFVSSIVSSAARSYAEEQRRK